MGLVGQVMRVKVLGKAMHKTGTDCGTVEWVDGEYIEKFICLSLCTLVDLPKHNNFPWYG